MRLRILVLESEGENIALVKQDDEELCAAKVGSGPSPRAAVQDAVNAYFAEQAEPLLDAEPGRPPERRERLASATGTERTAVTPTRIREMLDLAAENRATIRFQYEDDSGNRSVRKVSPSKVEDRRRGMGFQTAYLLGFDHDRDDMRTFRVDRIEWSEVAA